VNPLNPVAPVNPKDPVNPGTPRSPGGPTKYPHAGRQNLEMSTNQKLTLSVPHFFLIVAKRVYQSIQGHTGLTHEF